MARHRRAHEVVAGVPPEQWVLALVRNLAEAVDGRVLYRAPREQGVGPAADLAVSWPPGPDGLADEVASELVPGGGVVLVARTNRWGHREQAALRETTGWLGLAVRLERLRTDRVRAEARARGLSEELASARERLVRVRELERRRLVRAITTTTLHDLHDVRRRLVRLDEVLTAEAAAGPVPKELEEVRDALDDLLDNFRAVVRGVYPAMLPDRGPRDALEELAATLPRPVRFGGTLGRRSGWQVESGLYHAVAAALTVLAGREGTGDPVTVDLSRDDLLRVRVSGSVGQLTTAELRGALGHDGERVAVLGGAMECVVTGGTAVVAVELAERTEPVEEDVAPPRFDHSALYLQVWELVRQGQQTTAQSRWDAVADRMTKPPRLALVREPGGTGTTEGTRAAALGVTVVDAAVPADRDLAERFLADDGPLGSVDAVLCLVPPTSAFRATLRWGSQRVALSESAGPVELANRLVAWSPVIAARRAIVAVRELVSTLPADHPLRWGLDRVATQAHEIAELELLDDLEGGDPRLLRRVGADAMRLLGAHGRDPRTRLGLPAHASDDEVGAAAEAAARRWRAYAARATTGGRDRAASETLVRTAEGLLPE